MGKEEKKRKEETGGKRTFYTLGKCPNVLGLISTGVDPRIPSDILPKGQMVGNRENRE